MQPKLVVSNGKRKGSKIPLPVSLFLIGRDERCHLRPSSALVSRLHCVIGPAPGGRLAVSDMRSSNGTYVNGRRINGTVRLQHGDALQIGSLCFEIEVPDGVVPVSAYRIDHRKAAWLFADTDEQEQDRIQSGDTALLKALGTDGAEGDTEIDPSEGPSEPSSSVTLKAGDLLKNMVPKGSNGKAASGSNSSS